MVWQGIFCCHPWSLDIIDRPLSLLLLQLDCNCYPCLTLMSALLQHCSYCHCCHHYSISNGSFLSCTEGWERNLEYFKLLKREQFLSYNWTCKVWNSSNRKRSSDAGWSKQRTKVHSGKEKVRIVICRCYNNLHGKSKVFYSQT